MSRTYRDVRRAKEKRLRSEDWDTWFASADRWRWLTACPWAWRNRMMIRPARREQQHLLYRTRAGIEVGVWPDYKKPHVYYW